MSSEHRNRWVYLIGSLEARPVKIGVAANPESRLKELRTGSPIPLHLIWKTRGGRALESSLHDHFASYRLHSEWFDFGDENPAALVASAAVLMGYVAHPERGASRSNGTELPEPIRLARAAFVDAGDPTRMTSTDLYKYVASFSQKWESADDGENGRGRERYLKAFRDAVAGVDPSVDMTTRQWSGGRGYYLDTILELTGEKPRIKPLHSPARRRIGAR